MGRGAKRGKWEACAAGDTRGAERVHVRRPGSDRALCGRVVRGDQPKKTAPCSCFACMRRFRDTERPPPAPPELQPVMAERSTRVHFALRNSLALATNKTLCGREVVGMLATGPTDADCKVCAARAKGAA
jgi:hypothetical protein